MIWKFSSYCDDIQNHCDPFWFHQWSLLMFFICVKADPGQSSVCPPLVPSVSNKNKLLCLGQASKAHYTPYRSWRMKSFPNESLFTFVSMCDTFFSLSAVLHWHKPFQVSLTGIENISFILSFVLRFTTLGHYEILLFRSQTWMVWFCPSVNSEGHDTFWTSSIISEGPPGNMGKTFTFFTNKKKKHNFRQIDIKISCA